jgi:hypothetical protein
MRLLFAPWCWFLDRLFPPPRVHPGFLDACERARLERVTGRELGPSVPVAPWIPRDPASVRAAFASDAEIDRRFAELLRQLEEGG